MISSVIIAILVELMGAISVTYNLANENWFWASGGLLVMIIGLVLMYAAFRPVIL